MATLRALFCLVGLLSICLPLGVIADCELKLYIDGSQSIFNVTGVANSELLPNVALQPAFDNQRIGMTGTMEFNSPGGCPSNQRQLRRVLSDGNFTIRTDNDLQLYPSNATLDASLFARLEFLDLRFAYRWRRLRIGQSSSHVEADTTLRVLNGNVQYSVNDTLGFDVEPGEESLEDLASSQIQEAELTLNASRLQLEIPDAVFSFVTEVETGIDLLPSLNVTLNITGRILAEAYIECSEMTCGENGRCVALDSGESVCDCACGFTGTDCEIPSGFCNQFSEIDPTITLSQSSVPEEEAESGNTTEVDLFEQCRDLFSSQQCPDVRSEYSIENQQCVCVDGWRGNDCDLCEAGDLCADFFEEGAACLVDAAYDSRSGEKIYECDMRSTGLDVFIGNSLKFVCNTTGPRFYDEEFQEQLRNDDSIPPIGNTPFCTVDFAFQETTPVNCTAWGCIYQPGSTRVTCSTMQCDCEDCDAIEGLVQGITSVTLDCNDQSDCVVDFGGLSIAVEAPCDIAECLLPSNPDFTVFAVGDDGFEMNWDIFTISLPLVFLGILLLMFGFPSFLLAREIRRNDSEQQYKNVAMKEMGAGGAEILFKDVSCIVPIHSSGQVFSLRALLPWSGWLKVEEPAKPEPTTQLTGLETALGRTVEAPFGYKSVLRGVTGTVRKGQLMGVMGPSGGGKTTFLSIISSISVDNVSQRKVRGEIAINGRRAGRWTKRVVAFVPQDDKLLATLTVRESLMYSAILRKPGCSMNEIKDKVNQTLRELNLHHVQHSQVGGIRNRRGISGGERRRVTIGMELVIDPHLIILDEPTSGLDSFTALNLMHTLKSICHGGRTVILSVHQPTPAMLDMLDQVLLLAKGFQVYLGPPSDAAAFFGQHGFKRADETVHIAEHMLQVVSSPETLVPLLNSVYSEKQKQKEADEELDSAGSSSEGDAVPFRRPSRFTAIRILLWRGFLDIVRNPALLLAHVAVAVVIGVFCGGIFYNAPLNIEGAQNRLGAGFFVLAFLGFWSLTTIDLLHVERNIVARETSAGYYNPYLYLVSKILLDAVLLRVIPAMLLSVPLYFMMHLQRTAEKIMIFLLTVSTFNITVGMLSMAITLLSPSAGTASLLINTVLLIGLLFAGHLVNIPTMPEWVQWVHHLSPFHYGFQILSVNELLGLRMNFVVPGYASVDGIGGDVFLRTVGIDDQNITHDLRAFAIYYAIAFVLTFIAMWLSRHFESLYYRFLSKFRRSA